MGMKFAPAPRRKRKLEIVARVEDALQSCDKPAEVDKARAAIANAMKVPDFAGEMSEKLSGKQYLTFARMRTL